MKKACVLGLQHQETEAGQESNALEASIDFCTWALCIPRWVLRTKTEFSWRLWKSFSVRWCNATATPTTTFPLPVPHPGCEDLGFQGDSFGGLLACDHLCAELPLPWPLPCH